MGLLLFCFFLFMKKPRHSSIIFPESHQWSVAKPGLQTIWLENLFSFDFVCNASSVALVPLCSFHTCPWQIRINACFTEARNLLLEPNGPPAPESAQHYPDSALFGTWHFVPSRMWAQCAHQNPWIPCRLYLHLVSVQSPFWHPNRSATLSEGGSHVFVRIFLIPLPPSFYYWSPASARLC